MTSAGFCIAVAKRERDLKVMPLASTRERRQGSGLCVPLCDWEEIP